MVYQNVVFDLKSSLYIQVIPITIQKRLIQLAQTNKCHILPFGTNSVMKIPVKRKTDSLMVPEKVFYQPFKV